MKKILRALDWITDLIQQYILIITGSVVCLLIMVGAVMRYVLKIDFFGSEEITLFFAFWLYFIGSAAAAREKSHINANMMSLFTKSERVLKIFEKIKCIASLAICGVITYWCYDYISWSCRMEARSNIFKIPNIVAQIPIFLSFVFWCIYLIRDIGGNEKC